MNRVQVMERGRWVPKDGLHAVRKGQAFRIMEGPNQWSTPRIALAYATLEAHPKDNTKKVFSIIYKDGDKLGRFFEGVKYARLG